MLSKERREEREQDEDLNACEIGSVVPTRLIPLGTCSLPVEAGAVRKQDTSKCCSEKTKELSYIVDKQGKASRSNVNLDAPRIKHLVE